MCCRAARKQRPKTLLTKDAETPCDFNNDGVTDICDLVRMKKMLTTILS
ncbi:MAG: hypothetical protein IJT66_02895 [Clostridia bacterium]|nr:hypothetical protein [Clostridia bacterium]